MECIHHPVCRRATSLALVLEFLLYILLTSFALHATWLTWPDTYIDFSRELYLPWRVSCGDVLYRDLAYDFGPVSVYTNAALFAFVGRASIHALLGLNFVFWCAILLSLRSLLRRMASPAVATFSVSAFILLFSFNRYMGCGNFNFLAPYSHELARGFLFSLLALLSLDSAWMPSPVPGRVEEAQIPVPPPRPFRFLLPGALYALVLFTKPELAFAASASLAFLFVFHAIRQRPLLLPLLAFTLAAVAVAALVSVPFAIAFHSLPQALQHTLFNLYRNCFNPAVTVHPFYKDVLGTNNMSANLFRLLLGSFLAALPFLFSRFALRRSSSSPLRTASIAFLALASFSIGFFAFSLLNAALPLAPALLFLAVGRSSRGKRPVDARENPPISVFWAHDRPLALAFAVFALALAVKIGLHCSIVRYGFVLALPAFCCAVILGFFPPCPLSRASIAAMLFLGFAAAAIRIQTTLFRTLDISCPVHDGAYLDMRPDAPAFNAALDWIRSNTPPDSTLAVLPEGAILNVLSGRPNPTPYVYLNHPDLLRFGEEAVLAAYTNSPPDTLVLVRKPQDEPFGTGYAQALMAFLDSLYTPVFTVPVRRSTGESSPYLLIARKN